MIFFVPSNPMRSPISPSLSLKRSWKRKNKRLVRSSGYIYWYNSSIWYHSIHLFIFVNRSSFFNFHSLWIHFVLVSFYYASWSFVLCIKQLLLLLLMNQWLRLVQHLLLIVSPSFQYIILISTPIHPFQGMKAIPCRTRVVVWMFNIGTNLFFLWRKKRCIKKCNILRRFLDGECFLSLASDNLFDGMIWMLILVWEIQMRMLVIDNMLFI